MSRIGVFVCHCGTNIAQTVDVERLAKESLGFPGVVFSSTYKYLCSEPGQQMIRTAIEENDLDRIVIASCTPRMHEVTFRKMLLGTKVNPYMLEIANIREQCSWVHTDKDLATIKALDLVRMAAAKAERNEPLFPSSIGIVKKALVIGGGIAGIQAALDIADAGHEVTIVEKEPSIGGHMVMLDKTFPTLDCSACISTPKMVEASTHPNIALWTSCVVESVSGYIGNFEVTIRKKARYVNHDICTGCGLCETKCPAKTVSEFNQGMAERRAIFKPFAQAVPSKPVIDAVNCRKLNGTMNCGVCQKLCPLEGAINFEDQDEVVTETYGAIIVATGYELIDWENCYQEYGGGRFQDVITGLQFERIVSASGPNEGHILRPSDGTEPKDIVIIKCVGSRDPNKGKTWCSRACCMYSAKHAHQIIEKIPDANVYIFYMDVRTPGKGYEEFYDRTREDGANYIRGRVSKIYKEGKRLVCKGEDSLLGMPVLVEADMVVLETAMVPSDNIRELTGALSISVDTEGWIQEAHPKLRPVETQTAGVFLAGTCQGPKDIPDTVAQASAAAAKVCGLLSKAEMETSPIISSVDQEICSGCGQCENLCPYQAISLIEIDSRAGAKRVKRGVADVNTGLCQGCGACAGTCRAGAIDLRGFKNGQILREVDALCI